MADYEPMDEDSSPPPAAARRPPSSEPSIASLIAPSSPRQPRPPRLFTETAAFGAPVSAAFAPAAPFPPATPATVSSDASQAQAGGGQVEPVSAVSAGSASKSAKRRRGLGLVTPNACKECRKKRAKCDGQNPCGRCRHQEVDCVYEAPVKQSKETLRTEIEQMRQSQRTSGTIIDALRGSDLADEIYRRIRTGEPLESVSQWITNGPDPNDGPLPPSFSRNDVQPSDPNHNMLDGAAFAQNTSAGPSVVQGAPAGHLTGPPASLGFAPATTHAGFEYQDARWMGHFPSTSGQYPSNSAAMPTRSDSQMELMNWSSDAHTHPAAPAQASAIQQQRQKGNSWVDRVTNPPETELNSRPSESHRDDMWPDTAPKPFGHHNYHGQPQTRPRTDAYQDRLYADMHNTPAMHEFFTSGDHRTIEVPSTHWTRITLQSDLVQHLLALYFCWEYPTFASLSKEHFLEDFKRGNPRYCSSVLVNALLALGCRFSRHPDTRAVTDDPLTSGDHFFKEALRLFAEDDDHHKLTTIQALGIMSIREASCGRDSESWFYAGQSIRLALEMGLHRVDGRGLNPDEAAVQSATFWGAFALDHAWSLATGSLPQCSSRLTVPPKPATIDGIESSYWIPYTDDGAPLQRQCEQPSNVRSVYKYFCELSELVHESLYVLHSPGRPLTSRGLLSIYTKYLNWYDQSPEVLKLGHNFTPAVLFAHMYYHFAILLLFRPLIKLRVRGSSVLPRDVCAQAADAIQGLTSSYSKLYTLRRTPSFVPYFVLTSAIMHLALAASPLPDTREGSLESRGAGVVSSKPEAERGRAYDSAGQAGSPPGAESRPRDSRLLSAPQLAEPPVPGDELPPTQVAQTTADTSSMASARTVASPVVVGARGSREETMSVIVEATASSSKIDPNVSASLARGIADLREMTSCHQFAEQALSILRHLAKKWDVDIHEMPADTAEHGKLSRPTQPIAQDSPAPSWRIGPRGYGSEQNTPAATTSFSMGTTRSPSRSRSPSANANTSSRNFFVPHFNSRDFFCNWGSAVPPDARRLAIDGHRPSASGRREGVSPTPGHGPVRAGSAVPDIDDKSPWSPVPRYSTGTPSAAGKVPDTAAAEVAVENPLFWPFPMQGRPMLPSGPELADAGFAVL